MACGCKHAPAQQAHISVPPELTVAEASNPGPLGVDTGEVFRSGRTGQLIRVIARAGERPTDAIARVKARHTR